MKRQWFIVSTENCDLLGWFIVAGPFASKEHAEDHESMRTATWWGGVNDIHAVTRYRNAHVVTLNQKLRAGSGIQTVKELAGNARTDHRIQQASSNWE